MRLSRSRALVVGLAALLFAATLGGGVARAAIGPLYDIKATWGDTNPTPGDGKTLTAEGQFVIQARNIGDAVGGENLTIVEKLPVGTTVVAIHWSDGLSELCSGVKSATVKCVMPASMLAERAPPPGPNTSTPYPSPNGYLSLLFIDVAISDKPPAQGTSTATISGGGAPSPVSDVDQVAFSTTPSAFGLVAGSFLFDVFEEAYPFGEVVRQASERPFELRTNFDITARTGVNDGPNEDGTRYITSTGQLRTVEVTLPRGLVGNPEALPKCDPTVFAELGAVSGSTACPPQTQVGYLNGSITDGTSNRGQGALSKGFLNRVPIYNLEPPRGVAADFGFNAGGLIQAHIYPTLDPAQNYAIKTVTPHISSLVQVRGSEVTFWGVPADPAHDKFRYFSGPFGVDPALGAPFEGSIRPFLTNPMDCGFDNGGARIRIDSYNHPGQFSPTEEHPDPLNVKGCDDPRFRFEPDITMQPTSRVAGGPTGLDVHLEVPQQNDEVKEAKELYAENKNVKAIATPPTKKAVVTFPEGMTLSPSAAQGLGSCSSAQIGLGSDSPVSCPDNSQYGALTLHTPLLPIDEQPQGWIYIAKQSDNPFHNFLALYLVIQEPDRGILVKIPGRIDLDPVTGQITTTFDDLPQFPVDDFQLTLKGGVRAGLVNPSTCGTKTITAKFFSWHDPSTPHVVKNTYEVSEKADGSPCVKNLSERAFKPTLEASTLNNSAGSFSPLVFRLTRTDDDQEFSQLSTTLPQGLLAKLAGVGICSDAGIAQASSRTGAGEGALEQQSPSCPVSSYIGQTNVGAGVGVPLAFVPGKVYLAGPYKGAPLSIVVITPALVGPYDLGVISVRTALKVDPTTAQATAQTDPFPQIYQGIPVRIRDIRLKLDRPEFVLNPTSCEEKQITAHVNGTGGDLFSPADDSAADLSQRFQAAECASLGFKPKLFFRLFGATHRGAHPKLRAIVKGRKGDANIAGASVALPRSEFLDQGHIRTVCTRVQFAADQCPQGSIYGHAAAKTPLFDEAFEGPVYLRSSSNPLPDLVIRLRGPASQPIEVHLVSRVDSVNGGIRNTFNVVPDAPVTQFTLNMQGGKKGLLINSTDLCANTHRATARFKAQNGRVVTLRPVVRAKCGKAGGGKKQR
jgi:hypothetical protein